MGKEKEEVSYDEARRVCEEKYLYVVQKKTRSGRWVDALKPIRGKMAALDTLNEKKEDAPNHQWRCVQKNEADKYREGWKARGQRMPSSI